MSTQAAETGPDPHTTAGKLADLERRRHEAVHAGSEQAVAKQHDRGKKTARERIDMLLDPGSFTEFDELARHRAHDFGIEAMTPEGEPRHLHAHDRAPSPRLHDRHLEPRSRRVAGYLR